MLRFFFLNLCCTILVFSCDQNSPSSLKADLTEKKKPSDTIHFEQVEGTHWILVNAIFQDSIPAKLIMDNGTKWAIYLDQDFALQNRLISDSTELDKYTRQRLSFRVHHINDTAINTVIFDLKGFVGNMPDGLLGHDFLAKYIVEINYEQKYLYLHSPISFQAPSGFISIPMRRNSPKGTERRIKLSLFLKEGKKIQDEAVLDLGQGGGELFLAGGAARKHELLPLTKGLESKTFGRYVTGEKNIGCELPVDSINLGGVTWRNITARISSSTVGVTGSNMITFGNGLLRYLGHVFLDLSNNKLYLPSAPKSLNHRKVTKP